MTKKLGRTYYGFVATVIVAAAVGALGGADASDSAQQDFAFASGYGADATAAETSVPDRAGAGGKARAVSTCLEAAQGRYEGDVALAQVNRAWRGSEGWIVDLSLDVTREGKRPRRRDVACRQSAHGLQVARY